MADKGYHANEQLANLHPHTPYRTYIPEPESGPTSRPSRRRPCTPIDGERAARGGSDCSVCGARRPSGLFAHVCETGGARRTWLVGIDKLRKRYLLSAAAHNLSVLMRVLFGMGTPRGLQQFRTILEAAVSLLYLAWTAVLTLAASRVAQPHSSGTERLTLSNHAQLALDHVKHE